MDFLFNSDIIMHGGAFSTKAYAFMLGLLYLGVMGALWYVYYVKFEDRPGFAKAPDNNTWNWIYKLSVAGIIALITFLIIFIGFNKMNPEDKTPAIDTDVNCFKLTITGTSGWERFSHYFLTPLAWLSAGFLSALIADKTTQEDIDELVDTGKKKITA
jgi:hypothetical protein